MTLVPLEAALGLSTGYTYALSKKKEDEVRQGENSYQASLFQFSQVAVLSNVTGILAEAIPNPAVRLAAITANVVTPVLSFFFCPTFAAVKQGHYETAAGTVNQKPPTALAIIPEQLSPKTAKVMTYLADHTGDIANAGILVSTAALPLIGNYPLAIAMAFPLVYEALDSRGFVPQRISLMIERYMPAMTDFTFLATGNILTRALSAVSLSSSIPSANQIVHRKIDKIAHQFMTLEGPTMEEIDAPLVEKKDLSYHDIMGILRGETNEFELNPAHLSKWANYFIELPKDTEFQKFLELFDKINWEEKYILLRRSFFDDDRFQAFLREKFPDVKIDADNFEEQIQLLADEEGKTKEKYLADQIRYQLNECILVLKYEKPVTGMKQDLDTSVENCSQILSYLTTLNPENDSVEIEDILIKISMEAGEYCARGIKRASNEILSGILQQEVKDKSEIDPMKEYELGLRQRLQQERLRILQNYYLRFVDLLVQVAKHGRATPLPSQLQSTDEHALAVAEDVHTMDIYRNCFALGFYPMTQYERDSFGLMELFMWGSPSHPFRQMRLEMYREYQNELDSIVREIGELNFSNYIRQLIQENPNLEEPQKEEILEQFLEVPIERFHQLMFVFLGVMRHKEIWDEWSVVEIEDEEDNVTVDDLSDWTLVEDCDPDQTDTLTTKNSETAERLFWGAGLISK